MRTIIRYKNRKLYDVKTATYCVGADVALWTMEEDVQVIDREKFSDEGVDITKEFLCRYLKELYYEEVKQLPLEEVRTILRKSALVAPVPGVFAVHEAKSKTLEEYKKEFHENRDDVIRQKKKKLVLEQKVARLKRYRERAEAKNQLLLQKIETNLKSEEAELSKLAHIKLEYPLPRAKPLHAEKECFQEKQA